MIRTCILFASFLLSAAAESHYLSEDKCGSAAVCKLLTECTNIQSEILSYNTDERFRRLRSAACGYDGYRPKVCCPKTTVISSTGECGDYYVEKDIFHLDGKAAGMRFPWSALLQYENEDGTREFGCGGVLISNQYVLTSGNCLLPTRKKLIKVGLGENVIGMSKTCDKQDSGDLLTCYGKPILVNIQEIILHENFSPISFRRSSFGPDRQYNIGLLKLQAPVMEKHIKPICLPNKNTVTKNKKYFSAGWGANFIYGNIFYNFKRVSVLKKAECIEKNEDSVCASAVMKSTGCIGDTGGPLMGFNSQDKLTLVGIKTYPIPWKCDDSRSVNHYTDVRMYLDWIQSHMKD